MQMNYIVRLIFGTENSERNKKDMTFHDAHLNLELLLEHKKFTNTFSTKIFRILNNFNMTIALNN